MPSVALRIADTMTWGDIVVGVSTVLLVAFTAGTAYFALKSVRLSERQWRTATEPDVHLEVLTNMRTGTTDLALMNAGGTSRATCFALSVAGQRASGYVGDGFLKPGERIQIHCELPQSEDTKALLLFRGMDETSYARARGAFAKC
jgi:hypothetical protein